MGLGEGLVFGDDALLQAQEHCSLPVVEETDFVEGSDGLGEGLWVGSLDGLSGPLDMRKIPINTRVR